MFNLSLGAACLVPAMTLLGNIVNAAAAVAAVPTNSLREIEVPLDFSLIASPLVITVELKLARESLKTQNGEGRVVDPTESGTD
jgi:hypothetical protein